ncbi:MAG: rhomboid family intramembrane serine protease [Akkermansia sp.]|nr:rhomboid family intramembrane serine protease [Akkermansia sp.]
MNQIRLNVTQSLLVINILVFIVGLLVQRPAILCFMVPEGDPVSIFQVLGAHSWFQTFTQGQLWRLVTYQFVHANLGHIVFNMWALYFFGPVVEEIMGSRRYVAFYLACGVAGALFSSVLAGGDIYRSIPDTPAAAAYCQALLEHAGYGGTAEPWQLVPMVGASASIYGVMVAAAFMFPDARIRLLFPPVAMQLRTFAWVVIGIATAVILFNLSNAGGEAGHLGGIILGAIVMLAWKWRITHRHD